MDGLDAAGVALAGIELENEINMAGNNPDFRLPGEGRVLGLNDLYHDPEGKQVAKGYLQYLKVLAVLREVRDHSKLSRQAPLLPFSLVDTGPEGPVADAEELPRWRQPRRHHGLPSDRGFGQARRCLQSSHLPLGRRGRGRKASTIHSPGTIAETDAAALFAHRLVDRQALLGDGVGIPERQQDVSIRRDGAQFAGSRK